MNRPTRPVNPLALAIAAALPEAIAILSQDPEALASLRALLAAAPDPVSAPDPDRRLRKKELAIAIGKSVASIDRFDREGAPHTYCGDTKRYDLVAYRDWLTARGKKPTKSPKSARTIDLGDVEIGGSR